VGTIVAEPWADVVEQELRLGATPVRLLRPRSADALLDEDRFAVDEFLPYWAALWPSAVALARHVAGLELDGTDALELGCGLGLVSVAAARAGARVRATDWSPDALAFARANAALNGVTIRAELLDWRAPPGQPQPAALVLAADVLYEERNVHALLRLLPLVTGRAGCALVADPGRRHAHAFLQAIETGWRRETIRDDTVLPRGAIHRLWRR
jgi:predicted nicotinamide N-methyase